MVARRIEEAVAAVGDRERVIASTDCGFGTFTEREWVIEPVVWPKLKSDARGRGPCVGAAVGEESGVAYGSTLAPAAKGISAADMQCAALR